MVLLLMRGWHVRRHMGWLLRQDNMPKSAILVHDLLQDMTWWHLYRNQRRRRIRRYHRHGHRSWNIIKYSRQFQIQTMISIQNHQLAISYMCLRFRNTLKLHSKFRSHHCQENLLSRDETIWSYTTPRCEPLQCILSEQKGNFRSSGTREVANLCSQTRETCQLEDKLGKIG